MYAFQLAKCIIARLLRSCIQKRFCLNKNGLWNDSCFQLCIQSLQASDDSQESTLLYTPLAGNFFVYDGMVVPEKSPTTVFTDYLRDIVPMMKANPFESQNESFILFFEYYKSILMNMDLSLTSGNNFTTILSSISTIFHQIRFKEIFYRYSKEVDYIYNTTLPVVRMRCIT